MAHDGGPGAQPDAGMAETLRAHRAGGRPEIIDEPRWYAIYTRGRHEKQVERLLSERGFETFLPLVPRTSQWKDRRKRVEWPLFPSYVFGRFVLGEMYRVLGTPGVATIVRVDGRPAAIDDAELENVRRFTRALQGGVTTHAQPRPYFAEGEWVEIVGGPLEGVRGVVVEHRKRRRLLIGLKTIGQGLEVDVDVDALRPVAGP
jgi:transcription termination/antitermination protein NusG